MVKIKYFENIGAKLSFIPKHLGVIAFLVFIMFLAYVLTLATNIVFAINAAPNTEDVNKKFFTVKIRKDVISAIEKFSEEKTKRRIKYSGDPTDRNPFLPYTAESSETISQPEDIPANPAI